MDKTIKKIEQDVLNFLRRVEHKLPQVLEEAAGIGLSFTLAAEGILTGKQAGQIEALVPATVPFATEILAVLKELEVNFKALTTAGAPKLPGDGVQSLTLTDTFQKGLLFAAAGQIAAITDGSKLSLNRYNLAVQAQYSDHPGSASNVAA